MDCWVEGRMPEHRVHGVWLTDRAPFLFAEKKLIVYLPLLVSMYREYLDPNMFAVWAGLWLGLVISVVGCVFGLRWASWSRAG